MRDWRSRLVERAAGYVTPCLEWSGRRHRQGYGEITVDGRKVLVHRLAWTEAHGDPGPLLVCHHCDNPPCARLDHLYLGTHAVNNRDARDRGLAVAVKGEEHGMHKLTEGDVLAIRASVEIGPVLAARYGVSAVTIGHIRSRKTWRHI